MDDAGTEHEDGWVLVENGLVAATGGGVEPEADERVDLAGALVTPGLVNTHHHLYQTLTRARAQEADLFTWLKTLYPVWARLDEESEHAAARTGLAELALSGCTTVFDHHYVFPRGAGDLIEAEMTAARELGVRLVPSRGSMDLGESDGGLPPDSLVEDADDDPGRDRAAGRALPGARRRAVLAVLGHRRPDARVGRAGAEARADAAHAPGRDGRGGGVLPGALRLPAGRVPRAARLARRRRLVRALRPPLRQRHRALRRDGHRGRALPELEPAARRGRRAGAGAARRERAGRARRRRLGVERARRPLPRGEAGAARRPWARRPRGADGTRGAAARHAGERVGAEARRPRLARAGQERRPRRLADRRPRARGRRRPGRGARLQRAPSGRPARASSGEDVVREGRLVRADEAEIAQEHRRAAEKFSG